VLQKVNNSQQVNNAQRIDIVQDIYKAGSLEEQARQSRGKGAHRRVEVNSSLPKRCHDFLRCDENNTELCTFLRSLGDGMQQHTSEQVISTFNETVKPLKPRAIVDLSPRTHEEADTRMMVHASDAVKCG